MAEDDTVERSAGPVRRVVWRLLPPRAAVPRWARRLATGAAGSLAVGLPDLAGVAGGSAPAEDVPTGALAVGYALFAAALSLPVVYWAVVVTTAVGTMIDRRTGVLARTTRAVTAAVRALKRDHPKRGPSAATRDRPRF
jgi:hypothetical protein